MKKVIKFLGSAGFAAALVFFIVLLSFIGSFIPHGNSADEARRFFSEFPWITDVYGSVPFLTLTVLFAFNLFLCTLKLIPFALKGFADYNAELTETGYVSGSEKEFFEKLGKAGWKGSKSGEVYKAEKHKGGRYGVIILHAGVIAILFGALIGRISGFNGFMNILEGTSDDVAVLPSGELVPLGFEVRCDDFKAEYYNGTSRPRAYTSKITVIENGREAESASIDVNHPFKYNNVVFYQTSFGLYPNKNVKIRFHTESGSKVRRMEVPFEELFILTGDYAGRITDFAPALAFDSEGRIYSASDEMKNPAFLLEVFKIDEPVLRGWILKNRPESGYIEELDLTVVFDDIWGIEYTGLSVKKDPGTPVVYIGFVLVFFGLVFIYFLNYTAVFFTVAQSGGKTVVRYAVKRQRRYPLVNPGGGFKRLFL